MSNLNPGFKMDSHLCCSPGRKRRSGSGPPSAGSPSSGGWGRSSTREAWAAATWSPIATTMRRRARSPSAWQPSRASTREEEAWEVRGNGYSTHHGHFLHFVTQVRFLLRSNEHRLLLCPHPEERARIYSSDSDEGSDDDKAQRLMKAKKLDSDEVGALSSSADRGQCEAAPEHAYVSLLPHGNWTGQEILVLLKEHESTDCLCKNKLWLIFLT